MKIKNFSMEVTSWRGRYATGLDDVKELRFAIVEEGGKTRTQTISLAVHPIPDHKSLLDYLFEKAKQEFKNHIEGGK